MILKWTHIICHHSWSADSRKLLDWDNIKRYHTEILGWADVGYHFGIEFIDGKFQALFGRPLDRIGAHCIGMNTVGIGICFIGNFDSIKPHKDMLVYAADRVIVPLMKIFGIPIEHIQPHSNYAAKTCPGKLFPWDDFRLLIHNRLHEEPD